MQGGVIWPCAWVRVRVGAGPHVLPRVWPRVVVVVVVVVVAVVVVRRAACHISIPLWGVHGRAPPRFPEPLREVRLGGVKVRHALPN